MSDIIENPCQKDLAKHSAQPSKQSIIKNQKIISGVHFKSKTCGTITAPGVQNMVSESKTFVALLQHQEFKTCFLRKLQFFYLSAVAFQQLLLSPSDESAVQERFVQFQRTAQSTVQYLNNFLQLQIVLNAKYVAKVKQFASAIHRSSHIIDLLKAQQKL